MPAKPDDRTDGEVELTANHEQGDGDGENPERRCSVEDRSRRRPTHEVVVESDDRKEQPNQARSHDRPHFGAGQ